MSTSVSILGAAVVFAAAQLLLRKDSPSYAFLLSIGAAVFILLRLGAGWMVLPFPVCCAVQGSC